MLSFKSYLSESKGFTGTVYHGTNARFDKFDQKKSRIVNDNYGGGIAYFTDSIGLSVTYAKSMAKKLGGDPIVYSVELKLKKIFDVDDTFTSDDLINILPKDINEFARSAGLLSLNSNEYKVLSDLKNVTTKLTGEQVYRGLSKGNTQTTKARQHLIEKGYDGLRYNLPTTPKQSVYLVYNAKDIKIIKRQVVKAKT